MAKDAKDVVVTCNPHLYNYFPTYDMPDSVVADFFIYSFAQIGPLAVAGAGQDQVIIQDDSDFELRALSYHFTLADAAFTQSTRPVPNWTIQLTDTGAGRNLFNNPAPLTSIAYPGEAGVRALPWPKILRRNSTIQITLTNFDAAVATGRCRVAMLGRKLFTLNT